jgi:glycosyltransferase involved in cell wall biosynthesis
MRIGIEAQRLFRQKKHGMEIVTLELIRELQKIDFENEYYIYVRPDTDSDCIKPTDNFRIVELEAPSFFMWEQFILPAAAKKDKCHLLHCTSNTAPLSPKMPLLITLHDIIYLEKTYLEILFSQASNYQRFGNMYRKFVVKRVVGKADKIITVSNYEKKRINNHFWQESQPNKVDVVYNGVSNHFKKVTDEKQLQRVKAQYNLPDKFVLFFGNTAPKKNVVGVIKAFSEMIYREKVYFKLVMTDFNKSSLRKLLNDIGHPALEKHIHLPGYIINTDLPAMMSMSEIFLYPSLRESFGIPIIEGMKCEVPVITSTTSSMPEVSGGKAVLVDPYNPGEICDAMIRIAEGTEDREKLINDGLEQASKFSWAAMAANVLDIYKELYKKTKKEA